MMKQKMFKRLYKIFSLKYNIFYNLIKLSPELIIQKYSKYNSVITKKDPSDQETLAYTIDLLNLARVSK